jgi:UDP-N-acetylglucosamine 2-epimerase (non-hydrolysing)/GDP/UDP-N,N'-diacetylbacillosamine 2-epimerase (hydrolysing)
VINIGTRQNGRLRASNVIDVKHDRNEIKKAIQKVLKDKKFLSRIKNLRNPYGDGKAAKRIVKFIEETKITKQFIQKRIVDVQ